MKQLFVICFSLLISTVSFGGKYHPAIQYIFPLPGSEMLPQKATIILRLEDSYHTQISDFQNLIIVTGMNSTYSGTIFWAADDRTIIFKPAKEFEAGEKVRVTIKTSQMTASDFLFQFTVYFGDPAAPDAALQTGTAKFSTQEKINPYSPVKTVNGIVVPSDFPKITVKQYGETASGMLFFATNFPTETTGNYLIICQNDGTPYFYRRIENAERSLDFTLQPSGVFTAQLGGPDHYIVLDNNFNQIDTYTCGHGYTTDNHELQLLPNGHAFIIGEEDLCVDMSKIVAKGQTNAMVQVNNIQELDTEKNVIFEWRSWDHYEITDVTGIDLTQSSIDYAHINSIAVDYDDNLVISTRNFCEITKIDRNTGEIIWRLGGHKNQFKFLNDSLFPSYQHDCRPVAGKPNHYTLFDNGATRVTNFSRAVEYQIDPVAMTVENVWQFRHQPDYYAKSMGSVQRLDNGNTLIDWPESSLRVCEVTPEGQVLLEVLSLGHTNYRCRRFEWDGMLPAPYLIVENLGTTIRLIFNKFGDENVNFYKIYYGENPEQIVLMDTTQQNWYDADYLKDGTRYYFHVSAVDFENNESEYSNIDSVDVQQIEPGKNMILDSDFESLDSWDIYSSEDGYASGYIDSDGWGLVSVLDGGTLLEDVQLRQYNVILLEGREYQLEFDAYASETRIFNVRLESNEPLGDNYSAFGTTQLRQSPRHFTYNFLMENPTDADARLSFYCGKTAGNVFIDNVNLFYTESGFDPNLSSVVKINFQPEDVSVPEDYLPDCGEMFGFHENGFTYGWIEGENPPVDVGESLLDVRYSTYAEFQVNDSLRTWELKLPNGVYQVFLVMGAPDGTEQCNEIEVEDIIFSDEDGPDQFDDFSAEVILTDGRLTLRPLEDALNSTICFIEISQNETSISSEYGKKPQQFFLAQNYPNPFNNRTKIGFTLPKPAHIRLQIYDILGRCIKTLLNKNMAGGIHTVLWDGNDAHGISVASGVYFYLAEIDGMQIRRKLVLIK